MENLCLGFDSGLFFMFSPCACMGFLQVLNIRLTEDSKGVSV